MITFYVNGEVVKAQAQSIEKLIVARTGTTTGVAVAVDGVVVPRSQWTRQVQSGEELEILTAVQGG